MAKRKARTILERQLDARAKLWPELSDKMLWTLDSDGWVAIPRVMPLMLSIMDGMAEKGFPVGRAYLELWSRLREEGFLTLNRQEEMAFHAGFEGQRALRTWRDRMTRLAAMGFIGVKSGAFGDLSYAVVYNPFHVIKRAFIAGKVAPNKYQALLVRANEVGAWDFDDIDDQGKLVDDEEDEEDDDAGAKPVPKRAKAVLPHQSSRKSRALVRSKPKT